MPGWPTRASAHGSQTPAKARDPRAPTRPSSSSGAMIVATSGSRTRPAEVDRTANALSRHQSATDKRPFGEGGPDAKRTHGQRWSNRDAPTNLDSRRAAYGTSRSTCGSTNACSPWTTSSHTAHGPRTSRVGSTSSMRCTSPRERPRPWARTSSRKEQAFWSSIPQGVGESALSRRTGRHQPHSPHHGQDLLGHRHQGHQ